MMKCGISGTQSIFGVAHSPISPESGGYKTLQLRVISLRA